MRFIPRTLHGALDYAVGIFIALSPWLMGLPRGVPSAIPVVLGLGTLVYSFLTDYELGVIRAIPFRIHLLLDVGSGLVFLFAPYLLHLTGNVMSIYMAFGMYECAVALLSNPHVQGPLPPNSQW